MSIREIGGDRRISLSAFLLIFAFCTSHSGQAAPPYDVPDSDYTMESVRSHLNAAMGSMGQCDSQNPAACDYVFRQLDYADVALNQILRHVTRRNCLEASLNDPTYWAKQLSQISRDLTRTGGMQVNFESTHIKFTDYANMPLCGQDAQQAADHETGSEWRGELEKEWNGSITGSINEQQTIFVVSASYGVERCASWQPPTGRSNWVKKGNATSHAVRTCNGKTLCKYEVDWVNIGDPAFDCQKDYKIAWRCEPAGATYEEVRCPEGTDCDAGSGAKVTLACP